MSPTDDTFLSGAHDDTVRLWDLRSKSCHVSYEKDRYILSRRKRADLLHLFLPSQGLLNIAGVPSVAYDPSGLIFAVTLNLKSTTLLYDIRKLDAVSFFRILLTYHGLQAP